MSACRPRSPAKFAAGLLPAAIATPAFASDALANIPTESLSLEVQFAAYLATLLGTFVPVAFLIILYIQSESRKAGAQFGDDDD